MKKKALKQLLRCNAARIEELERALLAAQAAPPADHTEALIAGRVELALMKAAAQAKTDKEFAVKAVGYRLRDALKLRLHEAGTQEYWKEFIAWVEEWRKGDA